jgi:uncharacterized protein YbaR (Trm112 family)
MKGSVDFYSLLCCPSCRGELQYREREQQFACAVCRFIFPIIDGIPVLLPFNVIEKSHELFTRYWDSESKADLYDTNVEGSGDVFGTYNHESEVYGLQHHYNAANMDLILDAGCGNGRFFETFPDHSVKVGIDASLNLLKRTKQRGRGDFLVCGELEHLPFKDNTFATVISCRVLQHLQRQEAAVAEMARVVRDQGDVILELYNTWNLKTFYKQIRMTRNLRKILNAPFRLLFKSMSPFDDWGLQYDRYNRWLQVRRWMLGAQLHGIEGRGVGFGHNKYLLQPFYIDAVMQTRAPRFRRHYYNACFRLERAIGGMAPFRYTMEKFVIKASKTAPPHGHSIAGRFLRKVEYLYKSSHHYNSAARAERHREAHGVGVVIREDEFHLKEAVEWLKRAQDATPDRGVSRGYSVGWTPHLDIRGWQPSYPETTGYIIPTLFDCVALLGDSDLRRRAIEMADWEIDVQLETGAVRGGTIADRPSPAVFNTGQVMLGWLRTADETGDARYLEASDRAGRYLVQTQLPDGSWRKGNSVFALASSTTYYSRVGWALILHGRRTNEEGYVEAGMKCLEHTLAQQIGNGWFANNCLSDPSAPLTHTISYAMEGLLGGYDAIGDEKYLDCVRLAADHLVERIPDTGCLSGRLDNEWEPAVPWSCLTGSAQLAAVFLRLFVLTRDGQYHTTARKLLRFLKSTQNCISDDPGLRGGMKGASPFDGDYGRYEILNWATKFYVDALLLSSSCTPKS